MSTPSFSAARLVDRPLTNLAQMYITPTNVMRVLYPFVDVGTYGGQLIQFDDSNYEDVDDNREDDATYPEIDQGYAGKAFKLNTKGLRYRVGSKLMKEYGNVGMNWGEVAVNALMGRAALKHEIEAALAATTFTSYLPANRITLSGATQFNSTGDPLATIQAGKDAVSSQIGVEPNVGVMSQEVFSALIVRYANVFRSTEGVVRGNMSEDMLAGILGLDRVLVCRAIAKRNGVKGRVFGKHMVLAYVRPEALNADRIQFRVDGSITAFSPNFGYTYVMQGAPSIKTPWIDNDRDALVYDLDFDRVVNNVGTDETGLINHGYMIQNAVA